MRKFFVFLFILVLAHGFIPFIHAQTTTVQNKMTQPNVLSMPARRLPNVFGQDHFYTVSLRGNGEAVVASRIIFSNMSDKATDTLVLRVPKVEPKDIIVFQLFREKTCLRYQPIKPTDGADTRICMDYQDVDFRTWYGESTYQKATVESKTDTLSIHLPREVEPNGSGSILLYYRAFGYAKKNLFGAYEFSFETLKTEDKIVNLQIGITVDNDLVLAGTKGNVNYRFEEAGLAMMKSASLGSSAMASPQLDQMTLQIGKGSIVKTASNLQPLDSYTVKARYADSMMRLYWKEIGLVLVIVVIVLIALWQLGKRTYRVIVATQSVGKHTSVEMTMGSVAFVFGISFLSSLFTLAYTFFLIYSRAFLAGFFFNELSLIFIFLTVIISIGVYAFVLVVPALFIGVRRGLVWGIATFGMTLAWLFFDFVIVFLIYFSLSRTPLRTFSTPMSRSVEIMKGVSPEPSTQSVENVIGQ